MEAHWISQKLQFVTESHMSRHCAIQSLQQSKISWNIKYNDAQLQKEGRELIHQICDLHRKVILIPWVRRKKQPEKSNTFKCWVMPWIIQQGPVVPVQYMVRYFNVCSPLRHDEIDTEYMQLAHKKWISNLWFYFYISTTFIAKLKTPNSNAFFLKAAHNSNVVPCILSIFLLWCSNCSTN